MNGSFVLVLVLAIMFGAKLAQLIDESRRFQPWDLIHNEDEDPQQPGPVGDEERAA